MREELENNRIIHGFIESFLDTRKKEVKQIREIRLSCRKMIEERISGVQKLNNLLLSYKDEPWIKELLISHILLKIQHWVAFRGEEKLKRKSRLKRNRWFYNG